MIRLAQLSKSKYDRIRFGRKKPEDVFATIYRENHWNGESVSGCGSSISQTQNLVNFLNEFLRAQKIKSILDAPCGDFNWMKQVSLNNIEYTGADIVKELVEANQSRYQTDNIQFQTLDLIKDKLPVVDLIFVRDCLVHLSHAHINEVLSNLVRSEIKFLMTTTFPKHSANSDIVTGEWRPINLEKSPFNFPPPALTFNEGCTETGGAFSDKSLGLWNVKDITKSIDVSG